MVICIQKNVEKFRPAPILHMDIVYIVHITEWYYLNKNVWQKFDMELVFSLHIYETHVCSMYKRCFVKSVEQTFAYLFRWHMWKIGRDYFIEHHIRSTVLINGRHSALGTDLPYLATASLFFKLNILLV